MTHNQLTYWANKETQRHNLATESETNRSNVAKETETKRHNVTTETETERSNKAKEQETQRHNIVTEGQGQQSINESIRHNQRTEAINLQDANSRRWQTENDVRRTQAQTVLAQDQHTLNQQQMAANRVDLAQSAWDTSQDIFGSGIGSKSGFSLRDVINYGSSALKPSPKKSKK